MGWRPTKSGSKELVTTVGHEGSVLLGTSQGSEMSTNLFVYKAQTSNLLIFTYLYGCTRS